MENTPRAVSRKVTPELYSLLGLPSHSSHPIADKYTTGYTGSSGDKLENSLDHYSKGDSSHSGLATGAGIGAGAAGVGAGLASHGSAPKGDAVSGAYAGSGTNDALTGESESCRALKLP